MNRLLRWTLRLFPRSFRERYGEELVDHLVRQGMDVRRRRGWLAMARMFAFQTVDLFRTAWRERRTVSGSGGRGGFLAGTFQDARFALLALRKRPGLTATAAATVGLGVGAITAMFSVLDAVVLNPLPYDQAEALVSVSHLAPGLDDARLGQAMATLWTYEEENRVFESFGVWSRSRMTVMVGEAEPEEVDVVWMTPRVLDILRVRPLFGAPLRDMELERGVSLPAVVSYGFWQGRFGGDPDVIGRTFMQENVPWEVIGVLPADFTFLDTRPSVYLPLTWPDRGADAEDLRVLGMFDYEAIARLRTGVTLAEANQDVERMIPMSVERYAWIAPTELQQWDLKADVHLLEDDMVGHVRPTLWILFGTFGIVLLVASANVANLFLVGADLRQHEVAVRTALGASRVRVFRQLMFESLSVGIVGGVLGLALAHQATSLIVGMAPPWLPNVQAIALTPQVFLFALAASVAAGLICGSLPALGYSKPEVGISLKEGARSGGGGHRRTRARTLLAVGEIAMALVLVIGSSLMARSSLALAAVDPGFDDADHLLSFSVGMPIVDNYFRPDETIEFAASLTRDMGGMPGVTSASAVSSLPIDDRSTTKPVWVEGATLDTDRTPPQRRWKVVVPDYFATMGIPLLAGRELTWEDVRTRQPVAIVNEGFARAYWGDSRAALGGKVRLDPDDRPHEIIGVVGDVHEAGLQEPAPPMLYFPMAIRELAGIPASVRRSMTYVVRTATPGPARLLPQIRQRVVALKPTVPVANVREVGEIVRMSMARTTFTLIMMGLGAGVAVLLGTVGVYGVVSYVFERRARELGIRVALGASRADVGWIVLRHVGGIAVMGISVGLVAASALSGLLDSLLFGVTPLDLGTYLAASGLIVLTALAASGLPARRAVTVDAVEPMRSE